MQLQCRQLAWASRIARQVLQSSNGRPTTRLQIQEEVHSSRSYSTAASRQSVVATWRSLTPARPHHRCARITTSCAATPAFIMTAAGNKASSRRAWPGRNSFSLPSRLLQVSLLPKNRMCVAKVHMRTFHSTSPRRDILFVTVPAFKAFLLSITRVTLVVLPFWWR